MLALKFRRKLLLPVIIVVMVLASTASWWFSQAPDNTATGVATAAAPSLPHKQYEQAVSELQSLIGSQGPEAAFSYAEKRLKDDSSFARDCHPLMHGLGHDAFKLYGSFAEAVKHQNEMCNSGFTHGVIEASLAQAPEVRTAMAATCPADSTENFQQWQCLHGLGHGAMAAESRDLGRSLADCESLAGSFAVDSCANGALMEYFIVTDHGGAQRRDDQPVKVSDCRRLKTAYHADCFFYAPTAYLEQNGTDYMKAYAWCKSSGNDSADDCIAGLGAQAMKDNITKPERSAALCRALDRGYRPACVSGAIGLYINYYASSAAAGPLCQESFRDFQKLCRSVMTYKLQRLAI